MRHFLKVVHEQEIDRPAPDRSDDRHRFGSQFLGDIDPEAFCDYSKKTGQRRRDGALGCTGKSSRQGRAYRKVSDVRIVILAGPRAECEYAKA
jgi:hypothetical protein